MNKGRPSLLTVEDERKIIGTLLAHRETISSFIIKKLEPILTNSCKQARSTTARAWHKNSKGRSLKRSFLQTSSKGTLLKLLKAPRIHKENCVSKIIILIIVQRELKEQCLMLGPGSFKYHKGAITNPFDNFFDS